MIRRRARANGQFIVAVIPPAGAESSLQIQAIQTEDERYWWMAFTGFDEELRGSGSVMSTFMADMGQLFRSAVSVEDIQGVIVNPWNRTLMMDNGKIVLDVEGEERANMTVNDLLEKFHSKAGKDLDNDRILLSMEK